MNNFVLSTPFRKDCRGSCCCPCWCSAWVPAARPAYAAPPTNDTFANAAPITSIPFQHIISTTEATELIPVTRMRSHEGKTLASVKGQSGIATTRQPQSVRVDSIGSNYDTYIAVEIAPA